MMENKLRLTYLISSWCVVCCLFSYGQQWEEEYAIPLTQDPVVYSIDTRHNFYLGFPDGSIVAYDAEGTEKERFSVPNQSFPTLLEAQNYLKPFLFSMENQQITLLDRWSAVPKHYDLSTFDIYLGLLACPATDGDLWVIVNNPMRLLKLDFVDTSPVLDVQIDLGDSVRFMRAYQDMLLISDEHGFHVLDQFGAVLGSFPIPGVTYFHIDDDRVYATAGDTLYMLDVYAMQVTDSVLFPVSGPLVCMKLGEKYVFIENRTLRFFTLTNKQ